MAISCNIIQLSKLRICDNDGLTNVLLAQPAFTPRRNEETGYGPSPADLYEVECFFDDCLVALAGVGREHNLVIFPEAFVPISRVSNLIRFVDSDCPTNTVIIAGIESFAVQDALESDALPLDEETHKRLQDIRKSHHKFINICLILVRDSEGTSHTYWQMKMHPSHAEQSLPAMLTDDNVFFFTCSQLSFVVLICSDFIHRTSGVWLPVKIIDALQRAWDTCAPATSLVVDLLVNIQCNPKPNYRTFREAAKAVLYERRDSIRIDQTSVLISNWGNLWDGEEPILCSAIIYQAHFWQPPSGNETNVPHSYSFTRDEVVDSLNIVAFRFNDQGRCRFRMMPCSQADMSDPSRRFPLNECYFEAMDESGKWRTKSKSPWHDRCERWLPPTILDSKYIDFWSVPNGQAMQSGVYQKYAETRRCILNKTDTDLKHDCLCITLSTNNVNNPDMWGSQQRIALNKWASIATLFYYEDQTLEFCGAEWYSFIWRNKICIAMIDGQDLISCASSLADYNECFGNKLPLDPMLKWVALVMLYRHTRDDRQLAHRVTPLSSEAWHTPRRCMKGVRNNVLTRRSENVTRSRLPNKIFWCTAEDFDKAWEADNVEALREEMEKICEPALD